MKVYIGPYKSWFGPHQLAELLCFWAKDEADEYGFKSKPDWVFKFGEWLAYGKWRGIDDISTDKSLFNRDKDDKETILYKFLLWVEKKRKRTQYVKIDYYDTWSMDNTLAIIILPMLKQLQKTKHGSQCVDLEDVPEYMRTTTTEDYDSQLTFDFYKEDETKRKYDIHDRWDWVLDEMIWAFEQIVENDDLKFFDGDNNDREGYEAHNRRIQHGLTLFGKYFRGLWD